MGILPLQFPTGETAESLGLTGHEEFSIVGLADKVVCGFAGGRTVVVIAKTPKSETNFTANVRIDTPQEIEYFRHGGIMQYVLRQLLNQ